MDGAELQMSDPVCAIALHDVVTRGRFHLIDPEISSADEDHAQKPAVRRNVAKSSVQFPVFVMDGAELQMSDPVCATALHDVVTRGRFHLADPEILSADENGAQCWPCAMKAEESVLEMENGDCSIHPSHHRVPLSYGMQAYRSGSPNSFVGVSRMSDFQTVLPRSNSEPAGASESETEWKIDGYITYTVGTNRKSLVPDGVDVHTKSCGSNCCRSTINGVSTSISNIEPAARPSVSEPSNAPVPKIAMEPSTSRSRRRRHSTEQSSY